MKKILGKGFEVNNSFSFIFILINVFLEFLSIDSLILVILEILVIGVMEVLILFLLSEFEVFLDISMFFLELEIFVLELELFILFSMIELVLSSLLMLNFISIIILFFMS